jgi:hypothetical protein
MPNRPSYLCSSGTASFLMRQSVTLVTYLLQKYSTIPHNDAEAHWIIQLINHLRVTENIMQMEQEGAARDEMGTEIGEFPLGSIEGDEDPGSNLMGLAILATLEEFKK